MAGEVQNEMDMTDKEILEHFAGNMAPILTQ
jgi:hypothetical protein